MAFTPDELQSFNEVLERRLAAHRRDIEHLFDQRFQTLRSDFEQRLAANRQEIARIVTQQLHEHDKAWQNVLQRKLGDQQTALVREITRESAKRSPDQSPVAEMVDQALSAQLAAIEDLLNRHTASQSQTDELPALSGEEPSFEAIEVQTDLPWEDLAEVFGRVLDERLGVFTESTLNSLRNWEQTVASRLHALQSQVHEIAAQGRQAQGGSPTNMQEVFQGIEQLERLIESMHAAMSTNQAVLANRLYNHQQLPLERAHPGNQMLAAPPSSPNGTAVTRSLPGERSPGSGS